MDYLRDWVRNLFIDLLIIVVVCVGMAIFMRIFYPDTLSFFAMMVKWTAEFATAFKLWPFVILMVIVSALPRRRRNR